MRLYNVWYWVLSPARSEYCVSIPHCTGDTVRGVLRQIKLCDLGKYVHSWGVERIEPELDDEGCEQLTLMKLVEYGFLPQNGYPATARNHKGQVYFN